MKHDQKVQCQIENIKIELQEKTNVLERKIGEIETLLEEMNQNLIEMNRIINMFIMKLNKIELN